MDQALTDWTASFQPAVAHWATLAESPWVLPALLIPAAVAALVPVRAVIRIALAVALLLLGLLAWRLAMAPDPPSGQALALAGLGTLVLLQQLRIRRMAPRHQMEALQAEVAELHAGMERDLLAGMRAERPRATVAPLTVADAPALNEWRPSGAIPEKRQG